jgi:hypothetical protein
MSGSAASSPSGGAGGVVGLGVARDQEENHMMLVAVNYALISWEGNIWDL